MVYLQLHPPARGLPSKGLSLPYDPAATFRLQDRWRWQWWAVPSSGWTQRRWPAGDPDSQGLGAPSPALLVPPALLGRFLRMGPPKAPSPSGPALPQMEGGKLFWQVVCGCEGLTKTRTKTCIPHRTTPSGPQGPPLT